MNDPPTDARSDDLARTMAWDGVTLRSSLSDLALMDRDRLADAARQGRWTEVFEILNEHPELVNTSRPGGTSRFTPLHQAAHLGPPTPVVDELLRLGAWRTLRNAEGERPLDTARRQGHGASLLALLEPVSVTPLSQAALDGLQEQLQLLVCERAANMVREQRLRLPELDPITEFPPGQRFWFAVPGMYGGFVYWLEEAGHEPRLLTESWCRVVEGSGQRHVVTKTAYELLAEGFI